MVWRQVRSFARPVVVNGVVPAILTLLLGVRFGFGDGGLLLATRLIGIFFALMWALWFWWAELTFIAHGQTLAPEDRPTELVRGGPYRFCRSPMILGVYCGLIAEGFLLNPWIFVWAVLFIAGMSWYIAVREEPTLHTVFGAEWDEYAARTAGILPVPSRRRVS